MKYEQLRNQKKADINLDICGRDKNLEPGIRYGPVIRKNYIIECCTAGYGTVIINGTEFEVRPGIVYILFPGDTIIHTTDETQPREGVWCGVTGIKIGSYLNTLGITSSQPYAPKESFEKVVELINEIILHKDEDDPGAELRQNAYLHMIFGEMLKHSTQQANQDKYIHKAINYIGMHYNTDISVTDLATKLGLERCYFSTIFKESTGKSPHAYLTEVRIKNASILLESGEYTVGEIAQAVGIEPVNFSRVFKKHTGKSPNKYKKDIG